MLLLPVDHIFFVGYNLGNFFRFANGTVGGQWTVDTFVRRKKGNQNQESKCQATSR